MRLGATTDEDDSAGAELYRRLMNAVGKLSIGNRIALVSAFQRGAAFLTLPGDVREALACVAASMADFHE